MAIVSRNPEKVLGRWGECVCVELPGGREVAWAPFAPALAVLVSGAASVALLLAAALAGMPQLLLAAAVVSAVFCVAVLAGLALLTVGA